MGDNIVNLREKIRNLQARLSEKTEMLTVQEEEIRGLTEIKNRLGCRRSKELRLSYERGYRDGQADRPPKP